MTLFAHLLERLFPVGPRPVGPVPSVPSPPAAMPCPACKGWGRERCRYGPTCPVCGGFGSVSVREAERP